MGMFKNLFKNNNAATAIEYAILASGISIAIMGVMLIISSSNNDNYSGVADKVSTAIENSKTPSP